MNQRNKQPIKNHSKQELIKNDSKQGLNPIKKVPDSFELIKQGSMQCTILLGLYYMGKASPIALRNVGRNSQNIWEAVQRLIKKGQVEGLNGEYWLTDKGYSDVEPLIEFFRTAVPVR
jgi:hypothetical protein